MRAPDRGRGLLQRRVEAVAESRLDEREHEAERAEVRLMRSLGRRADAEPAHARTQTDNVVREEAVGVEQRAELVIVVRIEERERQPVDSHVKPSDMLPNDGRRERA